MTYRVIVTPIAEEQISSFIDYVARVKQEPVNAKRLLEAIWDAITTLESFPNRCPLAPENEHLDQTVRVLIVKRTLYLLFWVDEDAGTVSIEGFRHADQPPLKLGDRHKDP